MSDGIRWGTSRVPQLPMPWAGYRRASMWLGEQVGIGGAVLPATVEPARRHIKAMKSATLTVVPAELARVGMESIARPLRSATDPAADDPERSRRVLTTLLALHHAEPSAEGDALGLLAPTARGAVARGAAAGGAAARPATSARRAAPRCAAARLAASGRGAAAGGATAGGAAAGGAAA